MTARLETLGGQRQALKETGPIEVRKFSEETRAALKKEGYIINTLTGRSIASLRDEGREFWHTNLHKDNPQVETSTSMQSEVAINPNKLFLPESNNKTLEQQREMVDKFSEKIAKKVPGVTAIMGELSDYVDLAFTHLDTTGNYLFGKRYDNNYAATNTKIIGSFAEVGQFSPMHGLDVTYRTSAPKAWFPGIDTSPRVFAVPLLVPKA